MPEAIAPIGHAAGAPHPAACARPHQSLHQSAISAAVRLGHRALSLAVRVRQTMRETMLRVRDQLLHARTLHRTASFKRSIRLFLSRSAQNLLKQHCAKEATRRTASHMRRALHCCVMLGVLPSPPLLPSISAVVYIGYIVRSACPSPRRKDVSYQTPPFLLFCNPGRSRRRFSPVLL